MERPAHQAAPRPHRRRRIGRRAHSAHTAPKRRSAPVRGYIYIASKSLTLTLRIKLKSLRRLDFIRNILSTRSRAGGGGATGLLPRSRGLSGRGVSKWGAGRGP